MRNRALSLFSLIVIGLSVAGATVVLADINVNDFDAVSDFCDSDFPSMDVYWAEVNCQSGGCSVYVEMCEGPLDPDAKYRIHFDTEEPYFWQDNYNQECITTSDHTATYQPDRDKYTGPEPFQTNIGYDYLSFAFHSDQLGFEEGDYIAVWVDVHKKGVQDRAPDTDLEDGCPKPQIPGVEDEFGLLGEAMIVCAGGICNSLPPVTQESVAISTPRTGKYVPADGFTISARAQQFITPLYDGIWIHVFKKENYPDGKRLAVWDIFCDQQGSGGGLRGIKPKWEEICPITKTDFQIVGRVGDFSNDVSSGDQLVIEVCVGTLTPVYEATCDHSSVIVK